jgi:hypothetical protein
LKLNRLLHIFCLLALIFATQVQAAPKSEYWGFWDRSNENSRKQINHSHWSAILGRYLVTDHQSGINRFRYGEVSKSDRKKLDRYIASLSKTDPRKYNRSEQKAYWLNLYNALTVQLVVKHYPIESITDIGGPFSKGPWKKALVEVEGHKLSLNDIEHRILRPIWNDHKVHFGLNCASVSCPNLQPVAFTGTNVRAMLKKAGKEYINHPRGLHLKKGEMKVSSLFDWYRDDFAKDKKSMLKFFAHYADDRLALYLLGFKGKIRYDYDWSLND